jgi:thiamine biosynthesis lipoprotein
VFDWMHEVDRRFSTYKAESEVSMFGRPGIEGSEVFRSVLDRCAALWTATDGYFDVYAAGALDPSGYVKGWAVQVASDRLLAGGSAHHCLNAGGDVRVRGGPEPDRPWRIGIRHPVHADQVCCVIEGSDLGVATSGAYERGPHVLDPFRGQPSTGLRSVTVVGPDLGTADAYATAAVAMGDRGPQWLAGRAGYEFAVVTDDDQMVVSSGLPVRTPASGVARGRRIDC